MTVANWRDVFGLACCWEARVGRRAGRKQRKTDCLYRTKPKPNRGRIDERVCGAQATQQQEAIIAVLPPLASHRTALTAWHYPGSRRGRPTHAPLAMAGPGSRRSSHLFASSTLLSRQSRLCSIRSCEAMVFKACNEKDDLVRGWEVRQAAAELLACEHNNSWHKFIRRTLMQSISCKLLFQLNKVILWCSSSSSSRIVNMLS